MLTDMEIKRVVPKVPGGFPEYLPGDQIRFNRMLGIVRSVYERFGFLPLETPAVEFTEVLLAKGGGETDKQVYRLFAKSDSADQGEQGKAAAADSNGSSGKKPAYVDTGRSLHFDLTVPLARYVAQRQNELVFPFRRYQMQKVWRGESPQKGRFREFYQCDVDVIGTTSPLVDAEIPSIIDTAFQELGLPPYVISVNNRKLLNGMFAEFGAAKDTAKGALVVLDKIEKIGPEAVSAALGELGFAPDQIEKLMALVALRGRPEDVFPALDTYGFTDPLYQQGLAELKLVASAMDAFGIPADRFCINLSIARGLDYYTGTVYETHLKDYPWAGSVCSGGRYDNLAEYYTTTQLPGVGISIGLSRLYFVLCEIGFFKDQVKPVSQVMVAIADPSARQYAMKIAAQFRQRGINAEVYWEEGKLGKQIKYAQRLGIPYVAVVGGNEVQAQTVALKDMAAVTQSTMTLVEAIGIVAAGSQ